MLSTVIVFVSPFCAAFCNCSAYIIKVLEDSVAPVTTSTLVGSLLLTNERSNPYAIGNTITPNLA